MIVVADTSPLNYLIRLGRPEILKKAFGRVLIPSEVLQELQHPRAPPEVRLWAIGPPSWLEVFSSIRIDETLPPVLGAGERSAISLALQLGADILLVDERAARDEAGKRGIRITGTLALILQAALQDEFSFPETLSELRQLGFYVSSAVEQALTEEFHRLRKPPKA
jgi:predicted nucleic acid-binding protein